MVCPTSVSPQLYRAGKYESAEQTYNDLLSTCPSDSPESGDILDNLNSTHTHLEFQRSGFQSQLPSRSKADVDALENDLPALGGKRGVMGEEASGKVVTETSSSGQPVASGSKGTAAKASAEPSKKRTRHKLPKGVVKGKDVEQDVSPALSLRFISDDPVY